MAVFWRWTAAAAIVVMSFFCLQLIKPLGTKPPAVQESNEIKQIQWRNGRCLKDGEPALIPNHFGPCGRLRFARLSGFDLESFSFNGADLSQSYAIGTFARRAQFQSATLVGSVFRSSTFQGADFSSARMRGLKALRVNFRGGRFLGADLRDVEIMDSDLRDCDFRSADLRGARLLPMSIDGAVFNDETRLPFPEAEAFRLGMRKVSGSQNVRLDK